jgi:hypothetical protein
VTLTFPYFGPIFVSSSLNGLGNLLVEATVVCDEVEAEGGLADKTHTAAPGGGKMTGYGVISPPADIVIDVRAWPTVSHRQEVIFWMGLGVLGIGTWLATL